MKLLPMFLIVILSALIIGCSSGGAGEERASVSDDDDNHQGDDDDYGSSNGPPGPVPSSGDAPIDWEPAIRLDKNGGSHPNVKIFNGNEIEATWFEPDPEKYDTGFLNLIVVPLDDEPMPEPEKVVADAYYADWHHPFSYVNVQMIASKAFSMVYLERHDDYSPWEQQGTIANSDGSCTGGLRAFVIDIAGGSCWTPVAFIGYEHNSGVFGCVQRTAFANNPGFFESIEIIGDGYPTGALYKSWKILVATTHGAYIGDLIDLVWTEVPGGDYTYNQIKGTSLIKNYDGWVYMANAYSWKDSYYGALIRGNIDWSIWESPYKVLAESQNLISEMRIANDVETVVAAWLDARSGELAGNYYRMEAFSRVSYDGGLTWSEETRIGPLNDDQTIIALELAAGNNHAAVIYHAENADTGQSEGIFLKNAILQ